MKPVPFAYERPADLAGALALLADDGARALAGGQSLGPMLNLRVVQPQMLVDLAGLAELRACEPRADGVRLGALVTHAMLEDGRVLDPTGGILARVAAGIGYRAVRNRGTIGGSLAHADPAADWPVALAALGAVAVIAGRGGERRVAVAGFGVAPFETVLGGGEILVAVEVPAVSPAARWGWTKLCRKPGEFADALAAVLHDPERGIRRAVIAAPAGPPIVLAEASLAAAAPYLAALDPIARRRQGAALRRAIAQVTP